MAIQERQATRHVTQPAVANPNSASLPHTNTANYQQLIGWLAGAGMNNVPGSLVSAIAGMNPKDPAEAIALAQSLAQSKPK